MSWQLLVALALGLFAIRFTGLLAPAGSDLPPTVRTLAETMPLAIVAALVFVQVLTADGSIAFDLRAVGVALAIILAALRAPLALVVVASVVVTSLLRLLVG
jgi:branched-subunit amino acid transport protein